MEFIIVYYSWSKSIVSTKVRNESRCFMIRSCLLAGQCPAFVSFLFIACLFGSSKGYNYMFRRLIMTIFRLYMKYLLSSYTKYTLIITKKNLWPKRISKSYRRASCATCSLVSSTDNYKIILTPMTALGFVANKPAQQ